RERETSFHASGTVQQDHGRIRRLVHREAGDHVRRYFNSVFKDLEVRLLQRLHVLSGFVGNGDIEHDQICIDANDIVVILSTDHERVKKKNCEQEGNCLAHVKGEQSFAPSL